MSDVPIGSVRPDADAAQLRQTVARVGEVQGLDLRGTKTFHDRFGRADVMLLTSCGYVCANRATTGAIDVAVWHYGDLVAWGRTNDPEQVALIFHQWKAGSGKDGLSPAGFLQFSDSGDASRHIAAVWRWMLVYGHDYLLPVARAAYAEPALRKLLPFPSHGALGLLRGRVARQTHQVTFRRYSDSDRWRVDFHQNADRSEPDKLEYHATDADSLSDAVALAAAEVNRSWPQ